VLHLHGGGFILGSPRSHRGLAAQLSAYAGASVWLPHYRLAPEHPFPAAFDDAVSAYQWLVSEGRADRETLVVAGDSAGGQLATALTAALSTTGQPAAAGLLLLSPWLELDVAKLDASIRDPMLPTSYGYACRNAYFGTGDPTDPRLNVLTSDVTAFPPVLLQVGGTEILTGCAQQFTTTLQAAGVPVELQIWPGQIHVWQAFSPLVPEGKRALQIAARFISART
jgi:acetyl esterase/lipase